MKLYQKLAQHIEHGNAMENAPGKYPQAQDIFDKTEEEIKKALPSGSGFDDGIKLDYTNSKSGRIVLNANFHHIHDNGYYCGWSYHNIIITPSLEWGFYVKVTGTDKRNIKEYITNFAYDFLNSNI